MSEPKVIVVGAGVAGLAAAFELVERGLKVEIVDRGSALGDGGCSWMAGGMLAPWCERASTDASVAELGADSISWWMNNFIGTVQSGSLVVAAARDLPELTHFAERTERYEWIDGDRINALEPDLAGRFRKALFFPGDQETLPQLDALLPQLEIDAQRVKLLGTSGWDYPSVHTSRRLTGAWFATPDPAGWRAFSERFGRSYGAMPPRLASLGHDAVVLAAALAASPKGARFTPGNLTRSSGFAGADGAFRLQPSGLVDRSLAVLELGVAGPVVVDPAATVIDNPQSVGKSPSPAKNASLN